MWLNQLLELYELWVKDLECSSFEFCWLKVIFWLSIIVVSDIVCIWMWVLRFVF